MGTVNIPRGRILIKVIIVSASLGSASPVALQGNPFMGVAACAKAYAAAAARSLEKVCEETLLLLKKVGFQLCFVRNPCKLTLSMVSCCMYCLQLHLLLSSSHEMDRLMDR